MAGIIASLVTPAETAVTVNGTKTVLQIIAPTNQRLMIKRWGIYFDGISTTGEPFQIKLVKQTSAGTSTTVTPNMISAGSETLQAGGVYNCTAEPTGSTVLDVFEVHPQQGWQEFIPLDQGFPVVGGARVGIVVTTPASASATNCLAKFVYEE